MMTYFQDPSDRTQKAPSVSTTVSSDNEEPSTSSYTPPSLKNEVVEIDTGSEILANAVNSLNSAHHSQSTSHIDDISTRALSMFDTTSGRTSGRAGFGNWDPGASV